MLLEIGSAVYDEEKTDDEANAAARVTIELVNTLSTSDSGEMLLSPLGYCPELSMGLIEGACRMDWSLSRRVDCANVLLEIVLRSRDEEVRMGEKWSITLYLILSYLNLSNLFLSRFLNPSP